MSDWFASQFKRGRKTFDVSTGSASAISLDAASLILSIVGTPSATSTLTVALDPLGDIWVVENLTAHAVLIGGGVGSAASVAAGERDVVQSDGANCYSVIRNGGPAPVVILPPYTFPLFLAQPFISSLAGQSSPVAVDAGSYPGAAWAFEVVVADPLGTASATLYSDASGTALATVAVGRDYTGIASNSFTPPTGNHAYHVALSGIGEGIAIQSAKIIASGMTATTP